MTDRAASRAVAVRAITRHIDSVLDLNVVVADERHELEAALDRFRNAVRERDRAEIHLEHLFDLLDAEVIA
jgi:hypothetical protein